MMAEETDAALVRRYRAGDAAAADILLEKYKRLVRVRARELYLSGGDREDLLQEGMLGLFRAICTYDEAGGASFQTYAALLVTRQMASAVLAANRQKHRALNQALSMADVAADEGALGTTDSPESLVVEWESAEALKRRIDSALSPMERQVLAQYLSGMDYREIAEAMRRKPKAIDNALQRIRGKVAALRRDEAGYRGDHGR